MLRLRPTQAIWLGLCFSGGMLWIFLLQNWLFLNLFPGLLAGQGGDLQKFLDQGSGPSFTMLWISCFVALVVWLITTSSARPRNGDEVRSLQPRWWLAFIILVGLGLVFQLLFTLLIWQVRGETPTGVPGINYFPIPPGGWLLLMLFVVLDVVLLFWLPTLLASPRTYRLVVPGAVRLLGGR